MYSRQFSIARLVTVTLLLIIVANTTAQAFGKIFFGDKHQPGNRLHLNIVALVDAGNAPRRAISNAIGASLIELDNTLSNRAKSAIASDLPIAHQFYEQMIKANSLADVSKTLIQLNPDKAAHIITLGIVLYPDFAQKVFDGAASTGLLDNDEILRAALQAIVAPTNTPAPAVSSSTKVIPSASMPLGTGIGAGGTGSGDATVSTN